MTTTNGNCISNQGHRENLENGRQIIFCDLCGRSLVPLVIVPGPGDSVYFPEHRPVITRGQE